MLADPLPTYPLEVDAAAPNTGYAIDLAVTDISPGGSVRIWSDDAGSLGTTTNLKLRLSISHSVSNENKPVPTDRTLIRLDATVLSPDTNGNSPTGSVYMVFAQPRNGQFSPADMVLIARYLIGAILKEDGTHISNERLLRLLAGEP